MGCFKTSSQSAVPLLVGWSVDRSIRVDPRTAWHESIFPDSVVILEIIHRRYHKRADMIMDSPVSTDESSSKGHTLRKMSRIPQISDGSRNVMTPGHSVTQHVFVDCTGAHSESDIVLHGEVDETVSRRSSQVSSASGANVKVVVRVRPHNAGHHVLDIEEIGSDQSHVHLWDSARNVPFTVQVDHAFGTEATQQDVFDVVGWPMVDHCLDGFNSTIFAYGQTGSGKTHTMMGDIEKKTSNEAGLIPRVFEALFTAMEEKKDLFGTCSVKCSFLEIYNEEITDLLDPSMSGLQIRAGDSKRGVYVQGLSERQVQSADDVLCLIQSGSENRSIAATKMNDRSSRSHSVFTASIEFQQLMPNGSCRTRCSKLNLVDLAGSERIGRSGVTGEQLTEAKSINRSLSVLGRVITAIVDRQERKSSHVPFRDSRLTFLLQESLGGNSRTALVATVTPTEDSAGETYCTLAFAAGAKKIKCKAVVNESKDCDLVALRAENARLLAALEDIGSHQHVQALERELEQVRLLFDQNSSVITALRAEQSIIQRELVESKAIASRATQEASTLRASNVNLSNAFESLEEENAQLHAALNKIQDTYVYESGELEQLKIDSSQEIETLKKTKCDIEAKFKAENEELRTKVALLEKDVMYGNEKVESLAQALARSELKVGSLEDEISLVKGSSELYKIDIKELEEQLSRAKKEKGELEEQIVGLMKQKESAETASKEASKKEETLLKEISSYKERLEKAERMSEILQGKVTSEKASVAKYKRMVNEIGRLVNWAQASAPGSAAVTAALAAARSTGDENGGKPSPAAQAALRAARMSLATGTKVLGDATNSLP